MHNHYNYACCKIMGSLGGKMAPFIEILIAIELAKNLKNKIKSWKYNLAPPYRYFKILKIHHHILILS